MYHIVTDAVVKLVNNCLTNLHTSNDGNTFLYYIVGSDVLIYFGGSPPPLIDINKKVSRVDIFQSCLL